MARPVPRFGELAGEYQALWASMQIRAEKMPEVSAVARRILEPKARLAYEGVEQATGVPWYVVGLIHQLEAGGRFDRHLHNGDPLARRTVQQPKGRPRTGNGPFTWTESAIDAVQYDGLDKVAHWSLPRIAYELEGYNGWGYRRYHAETLTPYLWSYTEHYTRGKFYVDGKWSPTLVSLQPGALAVLKRLTELCPDIALAEHAIDPAAEHQRTPLTAETATKTMATSSEGNTSILVGGAGTVTTGTEVATAFGKVAASGQGFSLEAFLLALASSPTFWTGVICTVGPVYLWLRRRWRKQTLGV